LQAARGLVRSDFRHLLLKPLALLLGREWSQVGANLGCLLFCVGASFNATPQGVKDTRNLVMKAVADRGKQANPKERLN
jgi:hypothetical protein